MNTPQPAPAMADILAALEGDLAEGIAGFARTFGFYVADGPQWPKMLAELHAYSRGLAMCCERLADGLAAYAAAHPEGELPPPGQVPVLGLSAERLHDLIIQTGYGEQDDLAALILDDHYHRLAGPRPHTVALHRLDPQAGSVRCEFRDATNRLVFMIFYGFADEQVQAELEAADITPVPAPYVPRRDAVGNPIADEFIYSLTGPGGGLYDGFGRRVGD